MQNKESQELRYVVDKLSAMLKAYAYKELPGEYLNAKVEDIPCEGTNPIKRIIEIPEKQWVLSETEFESVIAHIMDVTDEYKNKKVMNDNG